MAAIQNGGGRQFENWFIGYISVAMAYIWTKFYAGTINHTPQAILPSKVHSHKIQDVAAAILWFFLTATTRLLLNIFAQNLAQRLETTSRKQFYFQISLLRKFNMAAGIFSKIQIQIKIHFNGHPGHYCVYSHKIWYSV